MKAQVLASLFTVWFFLLSASAEASTWETFVEFRTEPNRQVEPLNLRTTNPRYCQFRFVVSLTGENFYFNVTSIREEAYTSTDSFFLNAPLTPSEVGALSSRNYLEGSDAVFDTASASSHMTIRLQALVDSQEASLKLVYSHIPGRQSPSFPHVAIQETEQAIVLFGTRIEKKCDLPEPEELEIVSVEASSTYADNLRSYGPQHLLDRVDGTYWAGEDIFRQGSKEWTLTFSLGGVHQLARLDLDWYSAKYMAQVIDLYTSTDGVNFSLQKSGLSDIEKIDLDQISANSVRIRLRGIRGSTIPVIREVQIFGR